MRMLFSLLLAIGLVVGVAGNSFANCGADHANTPTPSSEKPQSQT
jgi:hypothetical protein